MSCSMSQRMLNKRVYGNNTFPSQSIPYLIDKRHCSKEKKKFMIFFLTEFLLFFPNSVNRSFNLLVYINITFTFKNTWMKTKNTTHSLRFLINSDIISIFSSFLLWRSFSFAASFFFFFFFRAYKFYTYIYFSKIHLQFFCFKRKRLCENLVVQKKKK